MDAKSYVFREQAGAGDNPPLLLVFHGTGGDENQFYELGSQLLPGARVIAVRGDVSEGGALRYFRRTGEGVYDMDDLALRTDKLKRFIAAQIGTVRPSGVFGFGYSNGANILASVQFAAPELFDRTVLLHPLIPFDPAPQPGLVGKRVLITAGERDPICPPQRTQVLADYFETQGATTSVLWHAGGHEVRQEELLAARDWLASR